MFICEGFQSRTNENDAANVTINALHCFYGRKSDPRSAHPIDEFYCAQVTSRLINKRKMKSLCVFMKVVSYLRYSGVTEDGNIYG